MAMARSVASRRVLSHHLSRLVTHFASRHRDRAGIPPRTYHYSSPPSSSAISTRAGFMESEEDYELRLRQHIRNLLLDYALTHLTTNYVTFTQDAVSEVGVAYLRQERVLHGFSCYLGILFQSRK